MAGLRNQRLDVKEVLSAYPAGTRLFCAKNGKTYQIGVKHGAAEFWMMCEDDGTRGKVDAAVVLGDFSKVRA